MNTAFQFFAGWFGFISAVNLLPYALTVGPVRPARLTAFLSLLIMGLALPGVPMLAGLRFGAEGMGLPLAAFSIGVVGETALAIANFIVIIRFESDRGASRRQEMSKQTDTTASPVQQS